MIVRAAVQAAILIGLSCSIVLPVQAAENAPTMLPPVSVQAQAQAVPCDEELAHDCFSWKAYSFAFAPDSKALFFSYRYTNGVSYFPDGQVYRSAQEAAQATAAMRKPTLSSPVLARIFLNRPDQPERIAAFPFCSTNLDQTKVSRDGKSIVVRMDDGMQIGVMDLQSRKLVRVAGPEYGDNARVGEPVFSKDGGTVYFRSAFDRGAYVRSVPSGGGDIVNLYPEPPVRQCRGYFCGYALGKTPDPALADSSDFQLSGDGKTLLMLAQYKGKTDELADFSRKSGYGSIDRTTLIYALDLASNAFSLSPINNDWAAKRFTHAEGSRQFERMTVDPEGNVFLLFGLHEKQDADYIYEYSPGPPIRFERVFDLRPARMLRIVDFAVSPDHDWIAYSFQKFFREQNRGAWIDTVVIANRRTGQEIQLRMGDQLFRDLVWACAPQAVP